MTANQGNHPGLVTAGFLVGWLVVSAPAPLFAGVIESFEEGFGAWSTDHYIDCEVLQPIPCPFYWSITRSTEQAYHGQYGLEGFLDGSNDDGTIWMERTFTCRRIPSLT